MITVLHVVTGLDTGGAELMLFKVASRASRNGLRHVVLSLTGGGPVHDALTAAGVRVYELGCVRGIGAAAAFARYCGILFRERPDVVQTWLYHADLLGTLGSLIRPTPLVWNIQSSDHPGLKSIASRLCVKFSSRPDAVIVNSEAGLAAHHAVGYRPKRWVVVPNGFDTDLFVPSEAHYQSVRAELNLLPDTPLVGMIARFHPQKDHETFLEAARILAASDSRTHFVLCGRGVSETNQAITDQLVNAGLASRVHLMGERQDTPRVTAALDVATLSSCFGEGFPGVVCEAMACGVPVVVTDIGDSAKIVGDTGTVVKARSPGSLAAAWSDLLHRPRDARRALGAMARERIITKWSLGTILEQYERLYIELARRRGSGEVIKSRKEPHTVMPE